MKETTTLIAIPARRCWLTTAAGLLLVTSAAQAAVPVVGIVAFAHPRVQCALPVDQPNDGHMSLHSPHPKAGFGVAFTVSAHFVHRRTRNRLA